MSPYSLCIVGLPCTGAMVAIIAGVVVYDRSRRFRRLKAILVIVVTFCVIAIGPPMFAGFISDVRRGSLLRLESTELVGVWKTTYQDFGPFEISGTETITLKADGTYQQVYKDGLYVYKSPWYQWWLEKGRIIHLEHGRFYLYGTTWAEDFAKSGTTITFQGGVALDGTEIILYARPDPDAPEQVILEHLPVDDPDAPDIAQFHRVSTWIPRDSDTP
jgi:hypothetical protein